MTITNVKKISQMFLIGIPNKESIPNVLMLIKNYSIGGVLLYKRAYDSLEELQDLITKLYNANKRNKTPLWIAIDQEGGRVNRLPQEFKNLPIASKMGKKDDELIKKASYTVCENLKNLGINLNLAPVLDLKYMNNSNGIGDRSYSTNPRRICEVYDALMPGYKKYKIMPVIKHFPGQGNLKNNSHKLFPVLKNYPTKDLTPFEHAIKSKCDAIMIGHVIIKGKTGIKPATLSYKFINEEIRNYYNYKGLLMTDEMRMLPIRLFYGEIKSIVTAVKAGNDIICLKYKKNVTEKTIKKLAKLLDKNKINIDDSYERIIKAKEKYNLNDETHFEDINIDKYNRQIEKISG